MPQKCFPERQKGLKPQSIKTVGKVTGSLSQVTTELMKDQNRGQIYQHKLGFGIKKKKITVGIYRESTVTRLCGRFVSLILLHMYFWEFLLRAVR